MFLSELVCQADWRECHRQVVAQRLLLDFGARLADDVLWQSVVSDVGILFQSE
jgi:hypothetical protein